MFDLTAPHGFSGTLIAAALVALVASPASAQSPHSAPRNMDDLGFNAVTDGRLFSRDFDAHSQPGFRMNMLGDLATLSVQLRANTPHDDIARTTLEHPSPIESSLRLRLGDDAPARSDADAPSNFVLRLQKGVRDGARQYSVSALGVAEVETPLDVINQLGWGVNLAGSWQLGELFTALSVTVGDDINHLLLPRFGDGGTPRRVMSGTAFVINPRLLYSLNDKGNITLEINRVNALDTLDTVHVGYVWKPWPSTEVGVEWGEKDSHGSKWIFGAEAQF